MGVFNRWIISVCLLLMISCTSDEPVNLDSEKYDKFTSVLADLSVATEMAVQDSSVYIPMRDSILNEYNVDTAWVSGIMRELADDTELWLKVWEEVTRKLEARKDSLTP